MFPKFKIKGDKASPIESNKTFFKKIDIIHNKPYFPDNNNPFLINKKVKKPINNIFNQKNIFRF
jgi:hypothetical protein